MAEERYIDVGDKKKIVLTDNDLTWIRDNPAGLTVEGAQVEFNEWLKRSRNRYMQARYAAMLKRCRLFTKSGKLQNGKTILSRNEEGDVTWAEWLDVDNKRYSKKAWEELPEVKRK